MGALASGFYDVAFNNYKDEDYEGVELYIRVDLPPTPENVKKYEKETE